MVIPSSSEGWEIEFVVGYLNSMSQAKLTGFYYKKKKTERKQRQKKKKKKEFLKTFNNI